MMNICLSVCVFFGSLMFTNGQSLNQSVALMTDILTGYDRRHRPIEDQSQPIQVNVSFDLVALQEFDEVEEKFSVVGLLYISWYDEKIVWNPWHYGGIGTQQYQLTDVWYPVLVLCNPFDSISDVGAKWMTVRYWANGYAFFLPGASFQVTCSVDVTYYPFDTQSCRIMFVPWGYSKDEMNLFSARDDVLQTYYTENGEWTIISTSARTEDNFLYLDFNLKRKPLFLVINILLPIVFMACINVFTFLLPAASGERISYAITCLLAIAVFLTLVSDNLPKTSQPMSIMCYYLMIILITSTLICLAAIMNLQVYFADDDKPVPSWCLTFARLSCSCRRQKHPEPDNTVHPFVNESKTHEENVVSNENAPELENILTWKDLSYCIDKLCIFLFTVVIIFVTALFMGILASNGGK